MPTPGTAEMRKKVDALIAQLRDLGNAVNPLELLSRVAFWHLMHSEGNASTHTQSEAQLEYLISLFLASLFPQNPVTPSPAKIQECIDTLSDFFTTASFFYSFTSELKDKDPWKREIIHSQRMQTLHVRGEAYGQHMRQTFLAIAGPHDALLKEAYGFTSADVLSAIEYASQAVQAAIDRGLAQSREAMRPFIEKAAGTVKSDGSTPKFSGIELTAEEIAQFQTAADSFGGPSLFEVVPRNPTEAALFRNLSASFGDNADFLTKLKAWSGWPLNETVIHAKPIIFHDGRFYVFHLPLFARSALAIVDGLIFQRSESYWQNTFLSKRDDYVEATAVDLVARILPGCTKHANAYYDYTESGERRRAELDGLIIYDDCLLIVEVKASGLSQAARRGAPERLLADLTASLDKAYSQAMRVLNLIRYTSEVPFLSENNGEIFRVRFADFKRV